METYKKTIENKEVSDLAEHIFQNGMGNIIILNSSPTLAQMKANAPGYYNNEIFIKLANGELKKFTVTNVP